MSGPDGAYALTGGTLIDGTGAPPVANAALLVEGNKIAYAGPAAPGAVPAGAREVRFDGKTVLPGLIDSHLHITASSGGQAGPAEYTPEARAARLRSFLKFGVTSVMDMGANAFLDQVKSDLASGALLGPRLWGVKFGITAPGSHPIGLGRELRLADRRGESQIMEVDTPEAGRAAVRRAASEKPDALKIYHTRTEFPGTSCFDCNLEKMKPDVLKAVVDEAHVQGLRVFCHIAWPSEAREAVEAGVDGLAHTITHAESRAQEVFDLMAEKGVLLQTTLTRMEGYFAFHLDPFLRERLRGLVPDAVLDSLALPNSIARRRNDDPAIVADARRILEIAMANVGRAHRAGVTIALGTDSGAPGHIHGAAVPREMELLHQCGLTPMQAIEAATKNAARSIGVADSLGTLEAGKLADAIVIDGDPLRDVAKIRKLALVIKDGAVLDPKGIDL